MGPGDTAHESTTVRDDLGIVRTEGDRAVRIPRTPGGRRGIHPVGARGPETAACVSSNRSVDWSDLADITDQSDTHNLLEHSQQIRSLTMDTSSVDGGSSGLSDHVTCCRTYSKFRRADDHSS